jgi:transposase
LIPGGACILHKGRKVRKYDKLSMMTGPPLQRAYTWLEPDEGKLSCPVLRGGRSGNASSLPDFNGLYALVVGKFQQNPQSGHLFLFANSRRDRMKILFFDSNSLWVCARRMEQGRLHWPTSEDGRVQLTREEFALLIGGIDLAATTKRKWYRKPIAEKDTIPPITA